MIYGDIRGDLSQTTALKRDTPCQLCDNDTQYYALLCLICETARKDCCLLFTNSKY